MPKFTHFVSSPTAVGLGGVEHLFSLTGPSSNPDTEEARRKTQNAITFILCKIFAKIFETRETILDNDCSLTPF